MMLGWIEPAALLGGTMDKLAGIAAGIAVLAFLLFKVIIPFAKMITVVNEEVAPNVKYMPYLAKLVAMEAVLDDVGTQFRTDAGSTLKDDIMKLRADIAQLGQYAVENRAAAANAKVAAATAETAAIAAAESATRYAAANAAAIKALEILVGTIKEHAKDDRDLARGDRDLARDALHQMVELVESAARTEASGVRADESRARVEASGARIEAASEVVAKDLAATQKRADDVDPNGEPGAAADAASQSPNE